MIRIKAGRLGGDKAGRSKQSPAGLLARCSTDVALYRGVHYSKTTRPLSEAIDHFGPVVVLVKDIDKMVTVDVHTHVYPPSYIELLKKRDQVPKILEVQGSDIARLIILPGEDDPSTPSTARGRPVGPEYWDIDRKLAFMNKHNIDVSVISLANPWLDFLPADEAAATAKTLNQDVNEICSRHKGRLFAFATLPLSASVEAIVNEVNSIKHELDYTRGVIMGTSGLGNGLDDQALDPVWKALEESGQVIFLHPHYGLPGEVYGPRKDNYGHVLPLALGFPLETTIAVTRMLLSGVFDRFPRLQVLLAHSGGTLPFLAGRIESCIAHDAHLKKLGKIEGRRDIWSILRQNIYLDAVIYGEVGLKAAADASGADRLMFGTDHPFFPPLDEEDTQWLSVQTNTKAVNTSFTSSPIVEEVMGGNAKVVLRLDDLGRDGKNDIFS